MAKPAAPKYLVIYNPQTMVDLDLEWSINSDPTAALIGYNVYRCEASKGDDHTPFVKVNTSLILTNSHRDSTPRLRLLRAFWYYVTAVNLDGESEPSNVATHAWIAQSGRMSRIHAELIRRKNILLNNEFTQPDYVDFAKNKAAGLVGFPNVTQGMFNGEAVKFYIRKLAGVRCTCFNVAKRQSPESCPLCFGTTYDGGYIRFGDLQTSIQRASEIMAMTDTGLIVDNNPRLWISQYPLIKNYDLFRRQDGKIFEIGGVERRTSQGVIIFQSATMKELPTTLSVYNLDTVTPGPSPYYGSG